MNDALTTAGFVALATLLLGVAAAAAAAVMRVGRLSETVAVLKERLNSHLENGHKHRNERG